MHGYDPKTLKNAAGYRHEIEAAEMERLKTLPLKAKPLAAKVPVSNKPSASSLADLQAKFKGRKSMKKVVTIVIRDYESPRKTLVGVIDAESAVQVGIAKWEFDVWNKNCEPNLGVVILLEDIDDSGLATGKQETVKLVPEYRGPSGDPLCDVCGKTLEQHYDGVDLSAQTCFNTKASEEKLYRDFIDKNKKY